MYAHWSKHHNLHVNCSFAKAVSSPQSVELLHSHLPMGLFMWTGAEAGKQNLIAGPIPVDSSVNYLRTQRLLQDPTHILGCRTGACNRLSYVAEIQPLGSGGLWWEGAAVFHYSSSEQVPVEAAQPQPLSGSSAPHMGVTGCGNTGRTSLSSQACLRVGKKLRLSRQSTFELQEGIVKPGLVFLI